MKITEDKADRERLFHRLTKERFSVRAKAYEAAPRIGWPRKHQLWPCVRLGAGLTWLSGSQDWKPRDGSRQRALNFLRGHSHEALMTTGQSLVFVYKGVGNEVDEWTGEIEAPFTEIKSTVSSSARMWPIVKRGEVELLHPVQESYFHSYFTQCCQNCVATGIDHCRLRIFFMNGEYGQRRVKCPECSKPLGEMKDIYRPCPSCKYKAYSVDLRSYILTFTYQELRHFDKEVFTKRRDQYNHAIKAESAGQLLMRAEPTRCFFCTGCEVGKEIGCENA